MKAVKLTTGKSLNSFLEGVIAESVKTALHQKSLQEKEKQQAASGGFGASSGGTTNPKPESTSSGDEGAASPSKTMDDETEKLKSGDVTPDDITDKLNAIRSGKSFKDENIKGNMTQYIESLSKAEKVALMAFLKGIAQIVTGEIPAQNAEDPKDKPSDVKMEKGTSVKTKHIQPNVIRGSAPQKKKQGGEEDTSSPKSTPAPITAKKR